MQINFLKSHKDNKPKLSDVLVVLFIFLIPLTHKEMFSVFDQDLMWSRLILVIIGVIGFGIFIKKYKNYGKDIFYIFLSSILFGQLFSLFYTLDQTSTIRLMLFQAAITFSYPFFREYTEKYGFKLILKSYLISFLCVFCFFIYQYILHNYFNKLTGGIWPVGGYPTRYGATFWDVNHYGAYLSSLFFVLVGAFLQYKKEIDRKFYAVGAFLALLALNFTGSRSALIGFGCAATFFMLFYFSKNISPKFKLSSNITKIVYKNETFGLGVAFVTGFFAFIYLFQDFIRTAFLYRSTSFFSHLYLLKAGIGVAVDNFTTGIGANAFYAYFRQSDWASAYYYIDKAALNYKLPLHNLWLEVLVETGLVAFIFFTFMWIVGIGLLIKLYRKKNDYMALGFAAGMISFLVGGLFYSYKAEFFWIYVIIAMVYGSKDLDENVTLHKFKDAKYIFYYIFESDYHFRKIALVLISILVFVFNLVYITSPLTKGEMSFIYRKYDIGIIGQFLTNLADMMRYVIGNYSFTPRIITVILYIGSFLLLIGIFNYFSKFYKSVMAATIVVCFLTMFRPAVYFDESWFYVFVILVSINMILIVLDVLKINFNKLNINYRFYVFALVVFCIVSQVSSYNKLHNNTYNSDLSFIVELAANRSVLNNSIIWVENDYDMELVKYYSDHIQKNVDGGVLSYKPVSEKLLSTDQLAYINFSFKNVFIVSGVMAQKLRVALAGDVETIKHRNQYVLITNKSDL